jgi:hypothetical protein
MRSKLKKSLVVIALLSTAANADKGDFYAGIENHGLSAKYDVTDKITAQAIIGVWGYGDVTSFTGRGLYKFKEKEDFKFYGYGAISSLTWSNDYYGDETVIGFGAGAGVEYDIRGLDPEFIPLYINFDVGMEVGSFDHYGGYTGLGWGLGIHYKF